MSSQEVTHALESALRKVAEEFKNLPDGPEMTDKISAKFEHTCNNPPTKDFEFLLGKPFTDNEVCVALFSPREEQIEYFSTLLAGLQELPSTHPVQKLGPLLISLLFLVHRKNWAFLKTFIVCNGLSALASLISSDNLYLRGQVLEIILCATDCDVYDWFKAPDSHADKVLHQNMIGFARAPATLSKLFVNRTGSYPGGSFRALQIIAFALSWLRALYTSDQKLQLSRTAVQDLQQWKEGKAVPYGNGKDSKESGADTGSDEAPQEDPEFQLAKALLEDFTGPNNMAPGGESQADEAFLVTALNTTSLSTTSAAVLAVEGEHSAKQSDHPTASESVAAQGPALAATSSLQAGKSGEKCTNQSDVSGTAQPAAPAMSASDMKEKGNVEFKAGRYASAQEWYYRALDALSSDGGDAHARAALHSNAATAAWKTAQLCLAAKPELELQYCSPSIFAGALATTADAEVTSELGGTNSTATDAQFRDALGRCVADCRAALAAVPGSCKAAYRLAAVLLLQQDPFSALRVVLDCVHANANSTCKQSSERAAGHVSGEVEDTSAHGAGGDMELLLQMKRRCTAAVLLAQRDRLPADATTHQSKRVSSPDARDSDVGLSGKVSEVLRNLLVQYQIELDLPILSAKPESMPTKPIACTALPAKSLAISKKTAPPAVPAGPAITSDKLATDKTSSGSDPVKPKKKKVKEAAGGTSSMAKRLQQTDDDFLDALMSRGPVRS